MVMLITYTVRFSHRSTSTHTLPLSDKIPSSSLLVEIVWLLKCFLGNIHDDADDTCSNIQLYELVMSCLPKYAEYTNVYT